MTNGDFELLARRTTSDIILHNKAFSIAKSPKYNEYKRGRASVVFTFLNKKFSGRGVKSENMLNQQLAEELNKPVIAKFEKR